MNYWRDNHAHSSMGNVFFNWASLAGFFEHQQLNYLCDLIISKILLILIENHSNSFIRETRINKSWIDLAESLFGRNAGISAFNPEIFPSKTGEPERWVF
jgi:hypothetical protein